MPTPRDRTEPVEMPPQESAAPMPESAETHVDAGGAPADAEPAVDRGPAQASTYDMADLLDLIVGGYNVRNDSGGGN